MATTSTRVLIASDKWKGSLTATEACHAIAAGIRKALPTASIRHCPIADGGEGFTEAIANAIPCSTVEISCHDALGRPIRAHYLMTQHGHRRTAIMEMSATAGLAHITPDDRNPMRANTYGTGEMIAHACLNQHAEHIIIGIGGSATNDAGIGMAHALGVRFLDDHHCPLDPFPEAVVDRLACIDASKLIPLPPITVACDVQSPLLGPSGATRVFGPQKGIKPESFAHFERLFESIASLLEVTDLAKQPGAGAAGGLGFGLMHFAKATLVPGFSLFSELTHLEQHVTWADLIITGEGSLDLQSLAGKGPVAIARLAKSMQKPIWALCGKSDPCVLATNEFSRIKPLTDFDLDESILIQKAADLLTQAAAAMIDSCSLNQ